MPKLQEYCLSIASAAGTRAPLRTIPRTAAPVNPNEQVPVERYTIACGLLGSFGGFLEEKFRANDFQLGRRNCQQFLLASLFVSADNVIVGQPGKAPGTVPVIPLLDTAADPIPRHAGRK
jgi:hypothetical protein